MKRFLAAVGILLIIIGISIYTLVDMQQSIDRLTEHTAAVRQQVEKEGTATAQRQCEELMAEWNGMEPRFLLYVRHDHLDNIMEHLSELPAYCLEDDRAEQFSERDVEPPRDRGQFGEREVLLAAHPPADRAACQAHVSGHVRLVDLAAPHPRANLRKESGFDV